jgi:hypothetical protein
MSQRCLMKLSDEALAVAPRVLGGWWPQDALGSPLPEHDVLTDDRPRTYSDAHGVLLLSLSPSESVEEEVQLMLSAKSILGVAIAALELRGCPCAADAALLAEWRALQRALSRGGGHHAP